MSAVNPDAWASPGATDNLADRIRAGDKAAETDFVRRYERGVRVLVRRHTRPGESMIDDFVQDVLSQVLEKLRQGELRDAAALPAYVRMTVVYTTTAEYRRRASRGMQPIDTVEELTSAGDPSEHERARQLAAQVRNVLAELPQARDRNLLKRFYLDERSKDEVCEELGISPDHFRRVVFRARERLRELLVRAGVEGE